jgi:hypothetical protein
LEKVKRLAAPRQAKELQLLLKRDPECIEAPRLAFDLMQRDWDKVLPVAVKKVPRGVVLAELRRYDGHVRLARAIAGFKSSGLVAKAHLAMGRLHDAMATYLDEVGTGPDTIFLIKDPNALYHTRVVDLRERLKMMAEDSYGQVVRMLKDASSKNETLGEAKTRLIALRDRYAARQPAPAPPEAPEAAPEPAPEPEEPPAPEDGE